MDASTRAELEVSIKERIRASGIDPLSAGAGAVEDLVGGAIDEFERSLTAGGRRADSDPEELKRTLLDGVAGHGVLQPLLDDPDVEEIWINGPGRVFCARGGRHELTSIFLSQEQIERTVERMLRSSGRRLDLSSPFVDATLLDGSRLHVAIPGVTKREWAVNIRKFVLRACRLDGLVELGSLSEQAARVLEAAVIGGLNVVVSGGTQTGKTTMLNCLAAAIPANQRVITCEEVFELQVQLPDVVAMQTRDANLEGKGRIDLRRLIVEALRMRPDRLIVGEVRQQEALDLLIALNSGLPGMTSIHANSAAEALTKLCTLPLLAGENVTRPFVLPTVAGCVDLVVHLGKEGPRRWTKEILAVGGRIEGEVIETTPLFTRKGDELTWTGLFPPGSERFARLDTEIRGILR